MKDYTCDHCNKPFKDWESQRKTKKVFCSRICKYKWNKTQIGYWKGKKIPFYKRPNRDVNMEKNGRWKGGRRIDKDGYVLIMKKDHPYSDYHGYVREHRLVMEKKIGRILAPQEVVHHINHDKQDNRPENLMLLRDLSEHQKLHNQIRRSSSS